MAVVNARTRFAALANPAPASPWRPDAEGEEYRERGHRSGICARDRPRFAGPAHQPRALVARLQRARARRGDERQSPAPGAAALSFDLLLEPRRVLHGARGRP